MKPAAPVLVLLLLLATPVAVVAEDVEPLKAGKCVCRYTSGNVEYTIYAPSKWRRRKPVPLMIHVPQERITPRKALDVPYLMKETEDALTRDGFLALHCWVLLEAHNKENASSNPRVDVERYRMFLERDTNLVLEVIDAVAKEAAVRKDAVLIVGTRYAAEAAFGVAARRSDRFAGVIVKELNCSILGLAGSLDSAGWLVLPKDEGLVRARRLPVALAYDPGEPNGEERAQLAVRIQSILQGCGFSRVRRVPGIPDDSYRMSVGPDAYAWAVEVLKEQEVQKEMSAARDALVAESKTYLEKGRLSSALQRYVKAAALEVDHDLEVSSAGLYRELEAKGRTMLADADTLSPAKRKTSYRKVSRLYRGTPFGGEVAALLEAMK